MFYNNSLFFGAFPNQTAAFPLTNGVFLSSPIKSICYNLSPISEEIIIDDCFFNNSEQQFKSSFFIINKTNNNYIVRDSQSTKHEPLSGSHQKTIVSLNDTYLIRTLLCKQKL